MACEMAKDESLKEMIFQSDCKSLFNFLTLYNVDFPWDIAAILEEIKIWAHQRQWPFKWCRRDCNRAAHWLTTGCRDRRIVFSMGCILPSL